MLAFGQALLLLVAGPVLSARVNQVVEHAADISSAGSRIRANISSDANRTTTMGTCCCCVAPQGALWWKNECDFEKSKGLPGAEGIGWVRTKMCYGDELRGGKAGNYNFDQKTGAGIDKIQHGTHAGTYLMCFGMDPGDCSKFDHENPTFDHKGKLKK